MNSFNVTLWNARKKCIYLSKCITLHLLVFELMMLVTAVLSHRSRTCTWFCDHNKPQMAHAKDNGSNSLRAFALNPSDSHTSSHPQLPEASELKIIWELCALHCSALIPGCMYSIVGENSYTALYLSGTWPWGGRDDQGAYYHFCIFSLSL